MQTRDDAVQSLAAAVRRVRRLTAELGREVEQELGLTVPQVQALDAVATGARQIGDVATHACAHISSASRVVDQLVRDGLVDRASDPDDRRAVVLALTADGQRMLERLETLHARLLARFVDGMSDDEVEVFADLFGRFVEGAVATMADPVTT